MKTRRIETMACGREPDGCASDKEKVIPDGVTSIGDYEFSYYPGPITINIPDSVTPIGASVVQRLFACIKNRKEK